MKKERELTEEQKKEMMRFVEFDIDENGIMCGHAGTVRTVPNIAINSIKDNAEKSVNTLKEMLPKKDHDMIRPFMIEAGFPAAYASALYDRIAYVISQCAYHAVYELNHTAAEAISGNSYPLDCPPTAAYNEYCKHMNTAILEKFVCSLNDDIVNSVTNTLINTPLAKQQLLNIIKVNITAVSAYIHTRITMYASEIQQSNNSSIIWTNHLNDNVQGGKSEIPTYYEGTYYLLSDNASRTLSKMAMNLFNLIGYILFEENNEYVSNIDAHIDQRLGLTLWESFFTPEEKGECDEE